MDCILNVSLSRCVVAFGIMSKNDGEWVPVLRKWVVTRECETVIAYEFNNSRRLMINTNTTHCRQA